MIKINIVLALLPTVWSAALPHSNSNCPANDVTSLTSANFSTYAPVRIQCPERKQWVRPASGLSDEETLWVQGRKRKALKGLTSYLARLHLEDFDCEEYLGRLKQNPSHVPTIGYAISGGGWASALTGTGPLRAFDDRFAPAVEQRTGGLLQSMTYLSGLSGGSWPPMSLATHNFPEIDDMVAGWHLDLSPTESPNNTAIRATPAKLFKELIPKFEAGFNVSMADWLGLAFGYEFVAGPNGGMATMVSDIAELSNFMDHEMPFPMWQAAQGTADDIEFFGIKVPFWNATIVEWSPLEFGAWAGPSAFFPTKYLGTKMADGVPVGECIVGFDRASFMLGAAADALNYWYIDNLSNNTLGSFSKRSEVVNEETSLVERGVSEPDFPLEILKGLQDEFQKFFNYTRDESIYLTLPNPFASKSSVDNESTPPANLTILDGSEMGQSLPLWSQIQPARNPEFIMAWDNDEDAHPYNWNNGTNLYDTYVYATNASIPFPIIPSPATFINRNYTTKPVFFGCNANLTNFNDTRAPLVLSMMNSPYSSYTNYSWLQETFTNEEMAAILTNGFNYVTQGNSTLDAEWPECLGCAAIDRSLVKVGMERTEQCQRCMTKYCWDGVEDNRDPGVIDLSLVLDPSLIFAEWNKTAPYWGIET